MYLGNGIYNITTVLTQTGYYDYNIQVENEAGFYGDIFESPYLVHINSSYPSDANSKALGSGVSRAIIGRKE